MIKIIVEEDSRKRINFIKTKMICIILNININNVNLFKN